MKRHLWIGAVVASSLCLAGAIAHSTPGDPTNASGGVAADAPVDPFVGAWRVSVDPSLEAADAGVNPFNDSMLFHDHTLSSEALAMLGFAPVAYELFSADQKVRFRATFSSDDRGTVVVEGSRGSVLLSGTLTWTRDTRVDVYHLSGEFVPEQDSVEESHDIDHQVDVGSPAD
jgi:hypothetical protein